MGYGPLLEREEGAVACLRQLGSEVRALDLWEDPAHLFREGESDGEQVRVLILEALDRPDLATAALRALHNEPRLEHCPTLLAVHEPQVVRMDPSAGFDDFVLVPYVPSELYTRIRCLEWRHSDFSNDERLKIGSIVIDRSAHEVYVEGRLINLTTKEFSLLACLSENRGRVKSREQLLAQVWGASYEGGSRTVDIHIRRLRAKLGSAFPLQTVRGVGYKFSLGSTIHSDENL